MQVSETPVLSSSGSHRYNGHQHQHRHRRPGAPFDSKHGASPSSSPPSALPPLPPSSKPWLPGALGLPPSAGGPSVRRDAEQDPDPDLDPSPSEEEMADEDEALRIDTGLVECGQAPIEEDQMAEEQRGERAAGRQAGGPGWRRGELACSLCKQLFSSPLQLRQHEYGHTLSLMVQSLDCLEPRPPRLSSPPTLSLVPESTPARYRCSRCPASFTLKSNADRHEKTIHFKRKLMQCAYCLKHFRDRTDLNRHLSSVHSAERVHACPACSRAFSTQKNLATHVKVCCPALTVAVGTGTGTGTTPAEPIWNTHVQAHNED